MTPDLLCDTLRLSLPALYECSPAPQEGVRVRTPMMYPDGDLVDVFVLERGSERVVTDHGDALGWLSGRSASGALTATQDAMAQDVCRTQGVELHRGRLLRRCESEAAVADAVQRVALAAVRVADIWFTFRARTQATIGDEVNEWLMSKERQLDVKRQVKNRGGSSREWTIDYEIRSEARTSMVLLLSTGTRGAVRRIIDHAVAGWFDLKHLQQAQSDLAFVSLFNDTEDVWREEDFRLVEEVSEIARWSHPDQFEQILKAT